MFSSAVKTNKNVTAVQQKTAGTTFFRKAGEQSFFGSKENHSFFGKPVQAKLTVSTPDDPQEKEADAVADKVMRVQEPVPVAISPAPAKEDKLERKEEEEIQPKQEAPNINKICCKEDNEEKLHTKPDTSVYRKHKEHLNVEMQTDTGRDRNHTIDRKNISLYHSDVIQCSGRAPPPAFIPFQQNFSTSKGSGSKLPDDTRMFMESRFNADFANVRVHTGAGAQQMNNQVQAKAFTHGNDIYFNKGNYAPDTSGGRLLLAHELTHTVQQGASPVNNTVAPKQFQQSGNTIHRAPQPAATSQTPASNIDISNKSGGSAVPDDAKEYFRHSLKTDVSDIRIHTDDEAADICRSRRVPAFTQGRHICFDPARYSPGSEEGGKLLAKQVSASLAQRSITVNKVKGKAPAPAKQTTIKAEPKDKKKTGPKRKGDKKKTAGGKQKGKHKGDKSDGPAVKSVKPDPKKSPSHPDEDPAFQKVVGKTKTTTKSQKAHDPAESKATDAQKASPAAPKEAESKAKERKTDGIDAAGKEDKPFDAKAFKAELLKKIEDVTPKTLEDATEFKENNKIGEVKNVMGDKVSGEKKDTTGPVANATAQPLQVNDADNKHPLPLPPTPKGPKPAGISAQDAAPKPKLDNEISLQDKSKSLDDEMKANNVTEEQLAKSNEPSFTAALDQKRGAQKDAVERPKQYRKDEKLMLTQAKTVTQDQSAHALAGMDAERGKNFGMVVQHQQSTKDKDHLTRAEVAKNIEDKYLAAEAIVNKVLDEADKESNRIFDEGAEAAKNAFENYVDAKMRAYKEDRYSGFWGGLSWLEDKIFGMPDEVNVFYTQGRQMYLDKMDQVITQVANYVTGKLNEAKQAIKDGKKQIDDYVSKLPEDLAEVGKQAASDIQDKFDSLEQSVNDKKDQLIEGLAKKYVDNVKKIDDRISEMKEANAGLIDKAIGFLKKVWQVIKDLTNLFTTILSRLASIIGTILGSPGGFFENLGKAFKLGFDNFKNKFLDYLEKGLMEWLATNLGIAGIELPEKFSPAAIFSLVLQVLGLTKQHIKERAVVILGTKTVAVLETAGGILYRVYNEGLGAIWDMIYEKLTDLKEIVWEAIKSFIKTKIIEAAIVFLLSLLNPIGAFIKVCMAIYDFLMMLVRFKDRIVELLDTILNAVMDVAAGSISGAANAIEKAFAKSIPIIIAFLAALLHLNDIGARVRDIITRIRAKVDKALDWVIKKGAGLVKGIAGAARRAVGGGGTPEERLKNGMADALVVVNRFAGKKVGALVLRPLLGAVKIKYGFKSLDVIPREGKWVIRGEINPVEEITSNAEVEQGPEGGKGKSTIQQLFGIANGEIIEPKPKYAGAKLRQMLSQFEPALLSANEDRIRGVIKLIRGKDPDYTIYQGAIYAPFIEDQEAAIQQLRNRMPTAGYFLSLERGGAMLGDQITLHTQTLNQSIEKEKSGDYRAKQLSDLENTINQIMHGKEGEHVIITISETSVSGSSTSNLLEKLRSIISTGRFPNLKFRVLVLQQTVTGLGEEAAGVIMRNLAKANRVEVVIANTPYILGEDVDYQIARKNENSTAPVIVFKGTEDTLIAYKITPIEGSTARDIIIDLVDGKYRGRLKGVL